MFFTAQEKVRRFRSLLRNGRTFFVIAGNCSAAVILRNDATKTLFIFHKAFQDSSPRLRMTWKTEQTI